MIWYVIAACVALFVFCRAYKEIRELCRPLTPEERFIRQRMANLKDE